MGVRRQFRSESFEVHAGESSAPRAVTLLGENWDAWLVGGISLCVLVGFQLFTPESADTYRLSVFMYGLSFLCNYPHFMLSYQLLYWDRRRDILKTPGYLWAAVLAPTFLLAVIGYGFSRRDDIAFSLLTQVMFLTVGWHYVKQIFGTIVVTSNLRGFFLQPLERRALLVNLYSLWGLSFLTGQQTVREAEFFGVTYDLLGVHPVLLTTVQIIVALGAVFTVGLFIQRYLKDGTRPAPAAFVAYATIFAWYLPQLGHRHFFFVIPFFHSLQYLLFVMALKKNQWKQENQQTLPPERRRRQGLLKPTLYFGTSVALGALFFWALPSFLDQSLNELNPAQSLAWGGSIFMAVFHLFINIHHYFIDNVIWKKENPDLKRYLF